MLKLNSELRAQAREALQGNWVMAEETYICYLSLLKILSMDG